MAWAKTLDWLSGTGPGGAFGLNISGGNVEGLEQGSWTRESNRAEQDRAAIRQLIAIQENINKATPATEKLKELLASLGETDIDVRDWDLFGGKKDDDKDAKESALEKMREELALMEELVGKTEEYKYVRQGLGEEYENTSEKTIRGLEEQYKAVQDLITIEEQRKSLVEGVGQSIADGYTAMIDGTMSVKDAFRNMAKEIIKQLWEIFVVQQIVNATKSAFGIPFANGGAFSGGSQVEAYANGGVVDRPTTFGMSGGRTGLMGEAGPEAIMPLKRGANGKLGVQMEGGSSQPVVINQSFNFSANGDDSVKKIIAQAAPQIAQMTQKSMMDQRRRGGSMKSTFG